MQYYKNKFFYFTFALFVVLVFQVYQIARATTWQPPTATFPQGNTAPPLDTSDVSQTKSGSIMISSDGSVGVNILNNGIIRFKDGSNSSFISYSPTLGKLIVTSAGFVVKGEILSQESGVTTDNAGNISLRDEDNNNLWDITNRGGKTNANDRNKLMFFHNNGTRWLPAALTIDTTGNVGIATTTPGKTLDVAGDIRGTQFCLGIDCRGSWLEISGAASEWQAITSPTVGISYSGGNVGIGTAFMENILSVAGSLAVGAGYANFPAPENGAIFEGGVSIGTKDPAGLFTVRGGNIVLSNNFIINPGPSGKQLIFKGSVARVRTEDAEISGSYYETSVRCNNSAFVDSNDNTRQGDVITPYNLISGTVGDRCVDWYVDGVTQMMGLYKIGAVQASSWGDSVKFTFQDLRNNPTSYNLGNNSGNFEIDTTGKGVVWSVNPQVSAIDYKIKADGSHLAPMKMQYIPASSAGSLGEGYFSYAVYAP